MAMLKQLPRDLIGVLILIIISLMVGIIFNEFQRSPITLLYIAPQSRLNEIVAQMGEPIATKRLSIREVDLPEMERINKDHTYVILDARPAIFYAINHIPNSLSLPRENFAIRYSALRNTLIHYQNRNLVVYCSDHDCNDGEMVAEALEKLGYQNVVLFRGGWLKWTRADQPVEQ